jgi:N-acetylmuramoyl-L-alanine amidase
LALLCAAIGLYFAPGARTQAQKHLTVYSRSAVYSVPIISVDGQDYIGLSDILEPLGAVDARVEGKKWKLRFTPNGGQEITAEFQQGKNKAKARGHELSLGNKFHLENDRGYIPYHDIGMVLPIFEPLPVDLHQASYRVFLGDVAIKFTTEMQKGAAPRLALNFSAPVNPTIATEPGHVRLVFRRDALVNAGPETTATGDNLITSSSFNDSAGTPQITVAGTVPLTASFANGNRTIYIAPVPSALPAAESPKPAAPPAQTAEQSPATAIPAPGPSVPAGPRFLIVIDPAHGGDERGAAITPSLAEKDVNLVIARRLQHELQNKGIAANLLRNADTAMAVDDRATATNAVHPALYICIHSANLGTGMRIFTALMSPSGATTHSFLPWSQAQAPYLDLSSQFAGSISAELNNRQVPVTALPAPLRPMRNIAAPAIAVEIAPPDETVANINNPQYQGDLVAAIANGIAAMKPRLQGVKIQ